MRNQNDGVQNTGPGTINISGAAIGKKAVYAGREPRVGEGESPGGAGRGVDVGIITVLSEEMHAMTSVLAEAGGIRRRVHADGFRCYEADIDIGGRRLSGVLTQTEDRGQRAAVITFERLRRNYAPALVALVGIAGGIHPTLRLGDVVVAQEVIYYDMRKETPTATFRRGQSRPVPSNVRRAINDFFSRNGEPYITSVVDSNGVTRECKVLPGPIASGEAVVADPYSAIREYVSFFNDKVLGLETEAGGLAEAFHEMGGGSTGSGWLVVRGISDHADADKNDKYHEIASCHAAVTLMRMLPDLFPEA